MTTATAQHRPGTAEDAVGGVVPAEVVRPTSVQEVAEVLREAAAAGRTVVPVGSGSKTSWAAPPTSCDLVLDTTGLARVVEHVAGDLVVVAEAGVRLADLQSHVGQAGQLLGLDPPEAAATLGGVMSANASGPRRLQYGTVRDLLIGCTVVLADGTVAKAGGKVVKNVAGYDLGKLYTGAHGTLGVVVSTTWRLHPVPPAQAAAAVALLGGGTVVPEVPPAFGRRPGTPDDVLLRLAHVRTGLPDVLAALPVGSAVAASAATGVTYAAVDAAQAEAVLPALREALLPHDGTAVVLHAPEAVRARLAHWGPVGDALALMRRVKQRFDPQGRMSPGRFVGGI
jgi:glycolate oxidase FAD binding subunit